MARAWILAAAITLIGCCFGATDGGCDNYGKPLGAKRVLSQSTTPKDSHVSRGNRGSRNPRQLPWTAVLDYVPTEDETPPSQFPSRLGSMQNRASSGGAGAFPKRTWDTQSTSWPVNGATESDGRSANSRLARQGVHRRGIGKIKPKGILAPVSWENLRRRHSAGQGMLGGISP